MLQSGACQTLLAEQALPPRLVQVCWSGCTAHFKYLDEQVAEIEKELTAQLADDDLGQRLMTVPGIGPITASVLASEMGDGKQYRCGRDFAAALGLVPRQYSTGGKNNLLGISKRGDKNLRRLLVQCARVYMQRLEHQTGQLARWVRHAHAPTLECRCLRPGQQAGPDRLGHRAHHTIFEMKEAPTPITA
jgi:transposase